MKSTFVLLLLLCIAPRVPAAESPRPAADVPLVERVHELQAAMRTRLDDLNVRWREATDPRVRRELARAISLAKLDFEIDVLELQRAERGPDVELPALDASLEALRAHRAKIVDPKKDEVEPTEDDGAREDS